MSNDNHVNKVNKPFKPPIVPKLKLDNLSPNQNHRRINSERIQNHDCLNYTFRNHKEKVLTKNRNKVKDFITDLEQTWELNMEMISTLSIENQNFQSEKKNEIQKKILLIKNLFLKKKELLKEKAEVRTKYLMDQQIFQEAKRRYNEIADVYHEQIDQLDESKTKKEKMILNQEKKFDEVEIYTQRTMRTQKTPKFDFLRGLDVTIFLRENCSLNIRKVELENMIDQIMENIKKIKKDNEKFSQKEFDNYSDDIEEEPYEINEELNNILKRFQRKVRFQEDRKNMLESNLKSLKESLKINKMEKYYDIAKIEELDYEHENGEDETYHQNNNKTILDNEDVGISMIVRDTEDSHFGTFYLNTNKSEFKSGWEKF